MPDGPNRGMTRRSLIETAAGTLLLSALTARPAWAGGRPEALDAWARDLVALKDALQSGAIDVVQWQEAVERLNTSVPVDDLASYLDIDALTRSFAYESNLAETVDPVLPADIVSRAGMRGAFLRVFGLRRGGAIIPHVHNHMVSSHLVVSGSFRTRTHDRVADLEDAVVLRPAFDGVLIKGDVLSMSDRRNNQHWLVAEEDRSMTFDVGIVSLPASWAYGLEANKYSMIFVDPTGAPERDGTVVAPVLSFAEATRAFAG